MRYHTISAFGRRGGDVGVIKWRSEPAAWWPPCIDHLFDPRLLWRKIGRTVVEEEMMKHLSCSRLVLKVIGVEFGIGSNFGRRIA